MLYDQRVPWQHKGRWYKIFLESDGTNITQTTSDIDGSVVSNTAITLPAGFTPVSYEIDAHIDITGAQSSISKKVTYTTSGKTTLAIMGPTVFDYANVYVYGYFES